MQDKSTFNFNSNYTISTARVVIPPAMALHTVVQATSTSNNNNNNSLMDDDGGEVPQPVVSHGGFFKIKIDSSLVQNQFKFSYLAEIETDDKHIISSIQYEYKRLNKMKFKSKDFINYLKSVAANQDDKTKIENGEITDDIIENAPIAFQGEDAIQKFFSADTNNTPWRKFKRSEVSDVVHENFKHPVEFANCRMVLNLLKATIETYLNSAPDDPQAAGEILKYIADADDLKITPAQAINKIYALLLKQTKGMPTNQLTKSQAFYLVLKERLEEAKATRTARIFGEAIKQRFATRKTAREQEKKNDELFQSNSLEHAKTTITRIADKVRSDTLKEAKKQFTKTDSTTSTLSASKQQAKDVSTQIDKIQQHFDMTLAENKGHSSFFGYRSPENTIRYKNLSHLTHYYETATTLNDLYKMISEQSFAKDEGFILHGGGTTIKMDKWLRDGKDLKYINKAGYVTVPKHVAKIVEEISKAYDNKITYDQALINIYFKILIKEVGVFEENKKPSRRDNETQIFYQACKAHLETFHSELFYSTTLQEIRKIIYHDLDKLYYRVNRDNDSLEWVHFTSQAWSPKNHVTIVFQVPSYMKPILESLKLGEDNNTITNKEWLLAIYQALNTAPAANSSDSQNQNNAKIKAYYQQLKQFIERAHPGIASMQLQELEQPQQNAHTDDGVLSLESPRT